jgi:hypothetical protein
MVIGSGACDIAARCAGHVRVPSYASADQAPRPQLNRLLPRRGAARAPVRRIAQVARVRPRWRGCRWAKEPRPCPDGGDARAVLRTRRRDRRHRGRLRAGSAGSPGHPRRSTAREPQHAAPSPEPGTSSAPGGSSGGSARPVAAGLPGVHGRRRVDPHPVRVLPACWDKAPRPDRARSQLLASSVRTRWSVTERARHRRHRPHAHRPRVAEARPVRAEAHRPARFERLRGSGARRRRAAPSCRRAVCARAAEEPLGPSGRGRGPPKPGASGAPHDRRRNWHSSTCADRLDDHAGAPPDRLTT